jgi:predicted 3-demethylubiquinone-9 3-methyltransferase (glyoxalase superfamily)
MPKISHCLWFDDQALDAATFYVSVFKDGKLGQKTYYTDAGKEFHQHKAGALMGVEFHIGGQDYLALNGGPLFTFNEAFSIVVNCKNQEEIDHYWKALTSQGGEEIQCGWLKDRFGLSWQIVPTMMHEMLASSNREALERVTNAYMQMKKFDIETLKRAFEGR